MSTKPREISVISKKLFEKIKSKYGDVASWAIWEDEGEKPKSNMGHINIFNLEKNPFLYEVLNNNVIMVGLNFSRALIPTEPFKNFHDLNPSANDFKIRYAFKDTEYYGAYMTDIIKNLEMKDSSDVKSYLRQHPNIVDKNIALFHEELRFIEAMDPIILAFGSFTYDLLKKHLQPSAYSKLIKLTHYSHFIQKEKYKMDVMEQINQELPSVSSTIEMLKNAHKIVSDQIPKIKVELEVNEDHLRKSSGQIMPLDSEARVINDLRNICDELTNIIKQVELIAKRT